jgi:hypothetical protein
VGDTVFTVYGIEDDLTSVGIALCPFRKKNAKRPIPPWETYLRELERKVVETTNSLVTRRFPKVIHAVTAIGFELKVVLFLLAHSIDGLLQ